MEEDGQGKRASSSRLSPLAQPFTLNNLNWFTPQPTWSSSTSLDSCASMVEPLSSINLEGDPLPVFHHNHSEFGLDSHFTQHPSANTDLDFGFLSSNEFLPDYTQHLSYGQASFSSNKNASLSYETLLEQGKPAVKGLKPCSENYESVREKCSDLIIGSENQFISRSTDQVDSGCFSFSAVNSMATPNEFSKSVMCSSSVLQNYSQTELPCTAPVVTWSHCNSKIALCKSGVTEIDPYTAKPPAFPSPKYNAFPAVVLGSSDTRTTFVPSNPVLSQNVDFTSNCAVNDYDDSSKCSPSGVKDLHHLLSGEGKEIHHGNPINKKKERKDGKPVSSEGLDPLLMEKSVPAITLTNIPDDLSLEHLGSKTAASLSAKLDENDSDLDSPCWKGTLASRQSPFEVSKSLSSHFVENEQEAHNSLNPLAPQFFPRHATTIVNYHSNYVVDDFSSFQESESSAVISFPRGHMSVDKAGSKSFLSINGTGTQSSNHIHEPKREYALLNNSESGYVLNFPESVSKLLSTHSKIDVPTILNLMHDLSEWLVQNCSNDLDSLNEHKYDLVQRIINNLSVCIQHRAGGKTPMPDITLTGTPCCPNKSTELHKCSNVGFQVTRTGALAVPHEHDNQNGHEGCKVNSHAFTERMLDSFPSCSDVGTEKSNKIIQIMGNAFRDNNLTKEEIDPQALLYKRLWLQAEAALCSMKYENAVLNMKLEKDGRNLDKNKVSNKLSF